jgi:hypothetical protein
MRQEQVVNKMVCNYIGFESKSRLRKQLIKKA